MSTEHHLLPFYGVAHIAYRAPTRLPRPLLQALVEHCSRRLQVQERLTAQLAACVAAALHASPGGGVLVLTEAAHLCMASRGVEQRGSSTCSTACLGSFSADAVARTAFLRAVSAGGAAPRGPPNWTAGVADDCDARAAPAAGRPRTPLNAA